MKEIRKSPVLIFLSLFLGFGWSFIGYNFAGGLGALICAFFAGVVVFYAFQIKEEE